MRDLRIQTTMMKTSKGKIVTTNSTNTLFTQLNENSVYATEVMKISKGKHGNSTILVPSS